jgi:O-acetyl-ADP-ribose deacetylase (regulator of RNase III)
LFATKSHWRENSDFNGIKEGLLWVKENYKKQGIESLALPALGCGLGNQSWGEVGPLMCQTLGDLDINVAIYLPQEHQQNPEWLTRDYLLNHNPSGPAAVSAGS